MHAPRFASFGSLVLIAATATTVAMATGCGGVDDPLAESFALASDATRATSRALALTTAVYGSATIAVIAPHETIAASIRNRFMSETASCATVAGTGATATLTTPDAGCTLAAANMRVIGSLACTVKDGPDPYLLIECKPMLTIDGLPLTGTLSIFTEQGNDYRFALDVATVRGDNGTTPVQVVIPDLTGGIAAQSSESSGNGTVNGTAFTQTAVKYRFAGCYPQDGRITISGGTLAFSSATQSSGEAVFTAADGSTRGVTLPKRPGCPIQ